LNAGSALRYTSQVPDASRTSLPGPSDVNGASARPLTARLKLLNFSGVGFAILQSACSAFIALSGVRLLVGAGAGALALAAGALRFADRVHLDVIRIPMMLVALAGSTVNLLALRRVRSLRRRSASAWRQRTIPEEKIRSERVQFAVSVVTLLILAAETAAHHHLFHHF